MQFAIELYDISIEQRKEVETILASDRTEHEQKETLYTTFKGWQQTGLRIVNPMHENCSMCDVKTLCLGWAQWYVSSNWPKRR